MIMIHHVSSNQPPCFWKRNQKIPSALLRAGTTLFASGRKMRRGLVLWISTPSHTATSKSNVSCFSLFVPSSIWVMEAQYPFTQPTIFHHVCLCSWAETKRAACARWELSLQQAGKDCLSAIWTGFRCLSRWTSRFVGTEGCFTIAVSWSSLFVSDSTAISVQLPSALNK